MKKILFLSTALFVGEIVTSQEFDANLDLRPRLEYRNGYKSLLTENQDAAAFISQRSRLNLNYRQEKLDVKFSLQNIRVWGDVPLLNTQDQNAIAIFEAFATYKPSNLLFLRLGRQVLSYDNQRILGGVDWAQQGQSHDAMVVSWLPAEHLRLDVGFAVNNESENLIDRPYLLNNYKTMQYAWYHVDSEQKGLSFLLLNNGYDYEAAPAAWDTEYRQTFGAFFNFGYSKWSGDFSLYGQTGKYRSEDLEGFYAGANVNYQFQEGWKAGLGGEYLSGTDMDADSDKNFSFTPLFGTNHAFNGFMDYFYSGNHQNSVGLIDFYGKLNYSRGRLVLSLIPHYFNAAADITDSFGRKTDNFLGTEIDLVGNYTLAKDISVNAGYSQIFGSESLKILKGGDQDRIQNFVWLSVSFKPQLFSISR